MAILRYQDPTRTLSNLRDELSRFFDPQFATDQALSEQWRPSVDIVEKADRYVVYADIPGVEAKDIKISIENNQLTIQGQRNTVKTSKDHECHREERFTGTFYRQFVLPRLINGDKVSAKSKNGVLEISIPKKEETQSKYIEVTSED